MADSDPAPVNFFICGTCTSKLDEPSPFPDIEDTPGVGAGRASGKNSFHSCFLDGKPPDRNTIVATICGHMFHARCLEIFFQSSIDGSECPSCKRKLTMKTQVIRLFPSAGYDQLQFTGGEPQFNDDEESENAGETPVAGADGNAGNDNNLGAVRSDTGDFVQHLQTMLNMVWPTDKEDLKAKFNDDVDKYRRQMKSFHAQDKEFKEDIIAQLEGLTKKMKKTEKTLNPKCELSEEEEGNSLDVPVQNTSKKRRAE